MDPESFMARAPNTATYEHPVSYKKCLQVILTVGYTLGEVTSQSLWSRYDRHFVGITRHNALS